MEKTDASGAGQDVVIITGPAGAGRSTAIRALEDFGFEAIDNLPLSLIPRLIAGPPINRPMVVGVDPRNRDFSVPALMDLLDSLEGRHECRPVLIFIDCNPGVLVNRYSETRRRHPSSPKETPNIGIDREQILLEPLKRRADVLIDTSNLTPHQLRAELARWYAPEKTGHGLAINLQSFAYPRGLPQGADMVIDCRFLRNPYWDADLRIRDGRDPEVAGYVKADPSFEAFYSQLTDMLRLLLPAYQAEGKSYFCLALGCTGGRHRSVAIAESLAIKLAQDTWQVSIFHRDMERIVSKSALEQRAGGA